MKVTTIEYGLSGGACEWIRKNLEVLWLWSSRTLGHKLGAFIIIISVG
jgi:hypothetical protein